MRLILVAIPLALAAVEGAAYWWTHPAPTDPDQPVLAYRPKVNAEKLKTETLKEEVPAPAHDPAQSISPISAFQLFSFSASTQTPLPELYTKSAPMLRCTGGEVFHVRFDDSIGVHCAFFEWDGTDAGSVFEAFRHMPEACMGSIGMELVSKEKPILYTVAGQGTVGLDRRARPVVANGVKSEGRDQASGDRGQEKNIEHPTSNIELRSEEKESSAQSSSSTFNFRPSTFDSSSNSSISASQHFSVSASTHTSLLFDHTIFRDSSQGEGPLALGAQVHAFRAVWVAGLPETDSRNGLADHQIDRLRTTRLKSAWSRFRPSHARVIQGAVRGTLSREAAWAAFEQAMLVDLKLQ